FSHGKSTTKVIGRVEMQTEDVSTDEWHMVVASWDREAGKGWIALDGAGASGETAFSPDHRAVFAVYLGGGFGGRTGGLNLPGLTLDDFVLYDVSLPILEAELTPLPQEDAEYLPVVEEGVRRTMNFMADLQKWGGWQCIYTWPTLIGSAAQGREWVDFDDYIDNDKGNGSAPLAARFLWAYETMGDYRWLDVGLRSGEFYLAAQAEEGYWVHGYRMTVHGIVPLASRRSIKFQDQDQVHPMYLLYYLYRLTGDERYLDAVKRAGEFYLKAQNPNGSYPHHYDLVSGVGRNARGVEGGGELNDRATNDAIDVMALMYHITQDPRYIQTMKRVGDWLLEAQGDEVPLWSDQYDAENNPAWARAFEPPSYGVTATTLACQALRELYRFSGDERYVEAIRRTDEWMKANLTDGEMSCYIDPQSGRPIAAWERKIYFLDDPASVAYLKTVPIGSGYTKTRKIGPTISRFLEQALGSKPKPTVLTAEAAMASLAGRRSGAEHALSTCNEAGVWTVPNVANFMGSLGEGFSSNIPRAAMMISYVEACRIAMGELAPRYPGSHDIRYLAYPFPDWYDVDWDECINQ
ncbi:MAG: pectate lyase, partial [Armatimonadetes bacterium]|nr:pectate lyase [Armatimonadota bacterium]